MQRLAKEGKTIAKIWREDFPKLSYWDVYFEVYGAGERSAQGIKSMVTTCINAMAESASKSQRAAMADELHELVWHLYENHKANQKSSQKFDPPPAHSLAPRGIGTAVGGGAGRRHRHGDDQPGRDGLTRPSSAGYIWPWRTGPAGS